MSSAGFCCDGPKMVHTTFMQRKNKRRKRRRSGGKNNKILNGNTIGNREYAIGKIVIFILARPRHDQPIVFMPHTSYYFYNIVLVFAFKVLIRIDSRR